MYDAKSPADIKFVPLDKTEEMDANRLMEFYEVNSFQQFLNLKITFFCKHLFKSSFFFSQKDSHLRDFLPIIRDSPVYPVITDANNVVCSLPPIINGDHSKIKLTTKNVLIESTAVKK